MTILIMTKMRITPLAGERAFGQQGLIYMIVYPSSTLWRVGKGGEISTVIMGGTMTYPDLRLLTNANY